MVGTVSAPAQANVCLSLHQRENMTDHRSYTHSFGNRVKFIKPKEFFISFSAVQIYDLSHIQFYIAVFLKWDFFSKTGKQTLNLPGGALSCSFTAMRE